MKKLSRYPQKDLRITNHAEDRGRERFSLSRNSIERVAQRALSGGVPREATRGQLRRYLDALWQQHRTADNIRLYGEYLFLFSGNVLITAWHLPASYRRHAAACCIGSKTLIYN